MFKIVRHFVQSLWFMSTKDMLEKVYGNDRYSREKSSQSSDEYQSLTWRKFKSTIDLRGIYSREQLM